MSKPETARSYKGSIIDDNAIISLNIKWLIQAIVLCAAIVYGYLKIEYRIQELERGMITASNEIETLVSRHIIDEEQAMDQLEKRVSFYEKEFNINPLSWGKRRKK
tara:strand:+ start:250 stop:567 length:318 start_codon:yes stop_codon:yes gene_type:complete